MANLKPFLDSTKISLERQASDQFQNAVETFARNSFGSSPQTEQTLQVPANRNDGSFYATSYAAALGGATSYRPKLKFLFKVEFIFTPEAIRQFPDVFGGSKSNDFTFLVKSVDRPKIDMEYEDDVNMYNFRTKVLKRIRHRELTVAFIDDTGNRVLKFFRALMMMHSPITRRQLLREGTTNLPDPASISSGNGMMFDTNAAGGSTLDNAVRGVTNTPSGNIIQTIRVKQVFVDPGEQLGRSVKEVIFDFINARIVSFDLDDLSHETSDVNLMTMQFDYDWMEIVDVGVLTTMDGPQYNITVPGIGGAPVDMSVYNGGTNNPGNGNPYLNIINNQIGRAAQSVTSTAINRAVSSVAGNGRFATLIGSSASNILGGIVGAASRDLAGGLTQTINQSAARAFAPNVIDSANGGPTPVVSNVRSNDDPLGSFIDKIGGSD